MTRMYIVHLPLPSLPYLTRKCREFAPFALGAVVASARRRQLTVLSACNVTARNRRRLHRNVARFIVFEACVAASL